MVKSDKLLERERRTLLPSGSGCGVSSIYSKCITISYKINYLQMIAAISFPINTYEKNVFISYFFDIFYRTITPASFISEPLTRVSILVPQTSKI